MNRKSISAEYVVKQSRTGERSQKDVAELPLSRIDKSQSKDGKYILKAIFNDGSTPPQEVNIDLFLKAPKLTVLFSDAYLLWGKNKGPATRETRIVELRNFFDFLLDSNKLDIEPFQIQEDVASDFNQWVLNKKQKNNAPLHPNTIRKVIGAVSSTLKQTEAGRVIAGYMPLAPKGSLRKAVPTEAIPWHQLLAIWKAAESEALSLRKRWEYGRGLIELGQFLLKENRKLDIKPFRADDSISEENLAICLAKVDSLFPNYIPSIKEVRKVDKLLADTLQYSSINLYQVAGFLYPSSRDLIPLALLIGIATAFNPDTLLSLEWKNIDRKIDRLGINSVEFNVEQQDASPGEAESNELADDNSLLLIEGFKPRSNKMLRRILDPNPANGSVVGLNFVLDLLQEITERLRKQTPDTDRDRVFIFVPKPTRHGPRGFGGLSDSPSGDRSWNTYLARFCDEHQIPRITLKQIRFTLIDYVQLINRGDLEASRKVGNHTSRITTWTHYTSDSIKKLLQESTGEIMLTRDRWIGTLGKIDPRSTPVKFDKSCATPGFDCLDPFDSPLPHQEKGRLCRAYGGCPICPMAIVKISDPISVSYWEALLRAIYRSISSMTASVWIERWAPVASDLLALISLVPNEVLLISRDIRVELPNVG